MLKHSILTLLYLCFPIAGFEHTIQWKESHKEGSAHITIPVASEDALYKEYMDFSSDNDAVKITQWQALEDATAVYDPGFKETKKIYPKDVTFQVDFTVNQCVSDAHIRCAYYRKSKGCIEEELVHIPLIVESATAPLVETSLDIQPTIETIPTTKAVDTTDIPANESWSCSLSHLIEHTQSVWLQCLLILLLGALLSLTPCIYPMIPITVGILQGQGSKSFGRNLLLSCCYTMGIAMTFALLGIIAAYTGKLFGTFMQHPAVICSIVLLLVYLAGSMLGFYEMHVPTFLKPSGSFTQGGSPLTAFIFGAVSGTVASPCVSPGLALVLSIVTGLANPFLGFIFLFAFGIGLSLPLLIIGTFSSSLNILPKAGFWMVEVKKVFGFMLLAMALYFLSVIIPQWVSAWLWALLSLIVGLSYLYASKHKSASTRFFYNLLGILFVSGSLVLGYFAVRATADPQDCTIIGLWTTDYACAQAQAMHEQKLLLLKVEAPCCSMCTAIDKKFFYQQSVINVLEEKYIPVRIDGGDTLNQEIDMLMKKFKVVGFPTILVVDPSTDTIIKRWASELYNYSVEQLVTELESGIFS